MTGKYFLDTNFLIYCFSSSEVEKNQRCRQILELGLHGASFVISTQVLMEFSAVMIKKFKLQAQTISPILEDLNQFPTVKVDFELIRTGLDIHATHQTSFWDSVIIAAAKRARCHTILTEDLAHGSTLAGIFIQNPFA